MSSKKKKTIHRFTILARSRSESMTWCKYLWSLPADKAPEGAEAILEVATLERDGHQNSNKQPWIYAVQPCCG